MPLPSFIFNAEKETPETLARRRALAEAMLNRGQTGVASNVGEGLAQLGQALGGRIKLGSVNRAETANRSRALGALGPLLGMTPQAPATAAPVADTPLPGGSGNDALAGGTDIAGGIRSTADALGIDPVDLATAISYETAGTFNPTKGGPTTKWGKHRGLIQFGEPQAKQFGVDWKDPVGSQLGPEGAVAKYLRSTGVKPGMGMMDIYSAINAGGVGRYGASDANNGGAPGTVADKVNTQMAGHRAKAIALLKTAQAAAPQAVPAPGAGSAMTGFPPAQAPQSPQIATAPSMTPAAPQIVPTAGPAPQSPQMAPQAPLNAYQRMMATSLGKEAGGLQAPPNRAQMAAVMGQGGQPSGGGILSNIFAGIGGGGQPPAASPFAPQSANLPSANLPSASGRYAADMRQIDNSGNSGAAPAGNRLGQLQSVISSPQFAWLEPAQQKFVMDEYERERAAANPDPMAKVQLETAQVNLDKLKNPKPEQPRTTTIDGVLLVEQPDGSWKPAYTAPKEPEPPKTRTVRRGNQEITQEWDKTTGTYKDVAIGDAFKTTPDTVINNGNAGVKEDKIFERMTAEQDAAKAARSGLGALTQAEASLPGAITGAAANERLALQKLGALFGVGDTEAITDTETFRSAIAPQVAAMLKATVGSTQISNADREFAEKAAGGAITLDATSIKRLINIMKAANSEVVRGYNERFEGVYPDKPENARMRALLEVQQAPKWYASQPGPFQPQVRGSAVQEGKTDMPGTPVPATAAEVPQWRIDAVIKTGRAKTKDEAVRWILEADRKKQKYGVAD